MSVFGLSMPKRAVKRIGGERNFGLYDHEFGQGSCASLGDMIMKLDGFGWVTIRISGVRFRDRCGGPSPF